MSAEETILARLAQTTDLILPSADFVFECCCWLSTTQRSGHAKLAVDCLLPPVNQLVDRTGKNRWFHLYEWFAHGVRSARLGGEPPLLMFSPAYQRFSAGNPARNAVPCAGAGR